MAFPARPATTILPSPCTASAAASASSEPTGVVTNPCPAPKPAVSSAPVEVYWARTIRNFTPMFEWPATRMLVPLTATALAVVELPDGMGVVTIPPVPKPVSRVPGVPGAPAVLYRSSKKLETPDTGQLLPATRSLPSACKVAAKALASAEGRLVIVIPLLPKVESRVPSVLYRITTTPAGVVKLVPTAMILPSGCRTVAKATSSWEVLTSVVTRPVPPTRLVVSGAPFALYLASATAVCPVELVVVLLPQAVRATDTRTTIRASPEDHEIFGFICASFSKHKLSAIRMLPCITICNQRASNYGAAT